MAALLVSFEPFTGHHIIEITAIEQQVYPDYPLSYGDLISHLGLGAKGWVIKEDSKIIAYALVTIQDQQAHLLKLVVLPDYRSKGLGKKLLDRVMALARERGASKLKLEVAQSNTRAILFYERLGLCQHGTAPDYYPAKAGRENALIMERALGDAR
jgi:ribosomal-protein-alanine N-acetyltransferase